jgi:hypothetical protein
VQVGTDNTWKAVSAGDGYTHTLKSDGTLWGWGDNRGGQLGDGTTTERHSPVQIGSDNTWTAVSAGSYHTVALKSDGSVWAWGDNFDYGALGDGTFTNRLSPVPIWPRPAPTSVALAPGWNFVSIPIEPTNSDIAHVLLDVSPNIAIVWGYDGLTATWKRYIPGQSNNTLATMRSGRGYWIYANAAAAVAIQGNVAATPVELYEGWNLIGYRGLDGTHVETGLNNIKNKWTIVWTWDSGNWSGKHSQIAILPFPVLTNLNISKAYWIKLKQGQGTGWAQ